MMKSSGVSVTKYSLQFGSDATDYRVNPRHPFQLWTCGYMDVHAADAEQQPHQGAHPSNSPPVLHMK